MRMMRAALVALLLVATGSSCGPADGDPRPPFCPAGTVAKQVCLQCGVVGGCMQTDTVCAQTCTDQDDCTKVGQSCVEGVCQVFGCI